MPKPPSSSVVLEPPSPSSAPDAPEAELLATEPATLMLLVAFVLLGVVGMNVELVDTSEYDVPMELLDPPIEVSEAMFDVVGATAKTPPPLNASPGSAAQETKTARAGSAKRTNSAVRWGIEIFG
ncbi:MAG: hypothetical protein ABSC94_15800 [Polyangiaceae bacterium]